MTDSFIDSFTKKVKDPIKFIDELHRRLEGMYNDLEEVGVGDYYRQSYQSAVMIKAILEWIENYED